MYRCIDGCVDGWMDGWMDGCMDGRMHGCMAAWMHGCMHKSVSLFAVWFSAVGTHRITAGSSHVMGNDD